MQRHLANLMAENNEAGQSFPGPGWLPCLVILRLGQ